MKDMQEVLTSVIREAFDTDVSAELTHPDERFGDYSTNVALQLAGKLRRKPREIAEALADALRKTYGAEVKAVSVAGPGFINITLSDAALTNLAAQATITKPQDYKDQVVVLEYSDPNPFKVLHAGHLYTTLVGDTISRLFEVAGAHVHRVNFGGDIGLHVAKNIWAIIRFLGGELPDKLQEVDSDPHKRAAWLSARYVEGNTAYEEDEQAKAEIIVLNKRLYQLLAADEHDSPLARIYWTGREWSYAYFDILYQELQVKPFEKYYPESVTIPIGMETVQTQLKNGVYQESDGAIVFNGEKHGLHTRVFISSHGLPTYEAKDVGLIMLKWQDYHFDKSVIITSNDQQEYMKVVQKSIEQFEPEVVQRSVHLTHGVIKLAGGKKMSSRKGNVVLALDILDSAREASRQLVGNDNNDSVLGAVKYAFLKQRIGGDIVYDPIESVSLEGNSGPYLQYAHARARSILSKAGKAAEADTPIAAPQDLQPGERSFARKISEYPEVVQKAVNELMPHHVCTYLYELAQSFNRFYEHNRVVGDEREAVRLQLVTTYAEVLKDGLNLLGIAAPDRM